jgi:hypothetical protein
VVDPDIYKRPYSPQREDYRLLIEREWADLHHSRVQEWTALGVTTGAHIGLIELLRFTQTPSMPIPFSVVVYLAALAGIIFCVLGMLLTCRHRKLMVEKLGWIFQAEDQLGLIKGERKYTENGIIPRLARMEEKESDGKPFFDQLSKPSLLSSSGIILYFYILLCIIDVAVIILFAIA